VSHPRKELKDLRNLVPDGTK